MVLDGACDMCADMLTVLVGIGIWQLNVFYRFKQVERGESSCL